MDIKVCYDCAEQHGTIYEMTESPIVRPPLHPFCRCIIEPMEAIRAGTATKDGTSDADFYLRAFGELPHYYIYEIDLRTLGWRDGKSIAKYAPGKMMFKGVYNNDDWHLPEAPNGRNWSAFWDLLSEPRENDFIRIKGLQTLPKSFEPVKEKFIELLDRNKKKQADWGFLFDYEIVDEIE